jgi:succinate-semialdehyde dehydrogenase/glutarate-semialdehyde dehydrogenase
MESNSFQTVNPATGEVLKSYQHFQAHEIEKNIQAAFLSYRKSQSKSVDLKSQQLRLLAQSLRSHAPELARQMTLEMGKAIKDSYAEIEKCAVCCDFFSDSLKSLLAPEEVKSVYNRSYIAKDSMGPVLAIMPWNFPIWQVIRFAAPAVGIGNPILLKHADQMAGCAEMIQMIFDQVEKGLLFNMRIDHDQASQIIADPRVRAVTLTGSAKAGQEVGSVAARNLKKSVLELGGSDAYVVFPEAQVVRAAQTCAKARMVNNGQSCVAAKRFIVHKSVLSDFITNFKLTVQSLRRGDPLNPETQVGSLAHKRFQIQLLEQCAELEKQGGEKIWDASVEEKFDFSAPGAFFPPRIYKANKQSNFFFREELFGPVALIFDFESEEEALDLCNRSIYGLGGAVFSQDLAKAERFARRMETGFVGINDQVKSDPHLPFGGVKSSGYGRELSHYGFHEFCNIKSIGIG